MTISTRRFSTRPAALALEVSGREFPNPRAVTALAGKPHDAARIAGYSGYLWRQSKATRQPNEARAYERMLALLREKLTADELESLFAEGSMLTEDEACGLALDDYAEARR